MKGHKNHKTGIIPIAFSLLMCVVLASNILIIMLLSSHTPDAIEMSANAEEETELETKKVEDKDEIRYQRHQRFITQREKNRTKTMDDALISTAADYFEVGTPPPEYAG